EKMYGLDRRPNFEDAYVLEIVRSVPELADELQSSRSEVEDRMRTIRAKLLEARMKRKPVQRDDKILTGWNGLMIRALASGGAVLNRPEYLQAAEKGALFIVKNLRDDKGRLLRTYRAKQAKLTAYLDDYAFLVEGLLALERATGDERWLNAAQRLTDVQMELFW